MRTWGVLCLLAMTTPAIAEHQQPTKAQMKAGRAHMKAGWAAQRAKKWADATKEFEAALKELDGDPRAQSELGWSAMNAGDFKKARLADEAAVAAAIDPKVKAASLYNLGLVQLRLEDTNAARSSFKKSIELRPNKTVSDELGKLDAQHQDATAASCPKEKKTCECLLHEYLSEDSLCSESKTIKAPAPGWSVYELGDERDKSALLLDANRDVVAELTGKTDHMRSSTDTSFSKLEALKIGGHTVVHVITTVSMMSDYMDETKNDSTMEDRTTEEYCTVDGSCVDAPTKIVRNTDVTKINADGSYGDITSSKSEMAVTMTLDKDGVVTVKLVTGSFDGFNPQILGPHKLW